MLKTTIIEHQQLNEEDLITICNIKSTAWTHSIESQKAWILKNLQNNDLHFLLYDKDELIAYMNLAKVEIKIDNIAHDIYGIGNVCTKTKGLGHGALLMEEVGDFLSNYQALGLLFCKNNLVPFYLKYNWMLIDKLNVTTSLDLSAEVNIMSYNFRNNTSSITYNDRFF